MVSGDVTVNTLLTILSQPLGIFIIALGAGFLIPLFYRAWHTSAVVVFMLSLLSMSLISASNLQLLIDGAAAIDIQTAGIAPPFSINLRFGLFEGGFVLAVNVIALLGAWHYLSRLREHAATMLLYLIMVMGINGMVMTRDLFNLFIFIEITSLATYSLIGMERTSKVLSAGFKYMIATSIASAFFLLGTIFIYYQTGTLNIDDIIEHRHLITGPIGFIACLLLLTSLLIELKPYPANGWGLDVYETAPSAIASLISVGVSAGVLFALYKVLPLMGDYLDSIALVAGFTFLFSNIIGLKQQNAKRLLGYSSIGQMSLLTLALVMLIKFDAQASMIVVVGGLFVNHLLAKAGLFWLAGVIDRDELKHWSALHGRTGILILFASLLIALVGLPPFPGFWAKWQLLMLLAAHEQYVWLVVILLGSLLEAAYLFRWFQLARTPITGEVQANPRNLAYKTSDHYPVALTVLLLFVLGYFMASEFFATDAGLDVTVLYLPLVAGLALWLLETTFEYRSKLVALVTIAIGGYLLIQPLEGIALLFGLLFIGGGLLVCIGAISGSKTDKDDKGNAVLQQLPAGFYPLLTVLLLSMTSMLSAQSTLSFFFSWELMTLSSWLLIALRDNAGAAGKDDPDSPVKDSPALSYLLFSLGSAYFILAGFALAYGATDSILLSALADVGDLSIPVILLLATGFLIKLGGFGFHIWLPGAYAESHDSFTAMLSSVVSKAGIFGLIVTGSYLAGHPQTGFDAYYLLGWAGILTATFGALMAVFQEDIKKLVAYSSMGQLGYIVTGMALMSHLGWVTALYMTVNHFLFKGILFLSIAGIILRTNERMMYRMGGLIKNMPFTFVFSMIAIIAMSGVPPLTGFGGKWMLFNGLMEQGWYWIAALAFFSSAVAFLYMFRFLHTVFLGQRKLEHAGLRDAPMIVLLPQAIMVVLIMVISAYPKLLLDVLSVAVAPWIGGELVWEGNALLAHYGYWNAPMIMMVVGGVWLMPLIVLLLVTMTLNIQKVEQFNIVYAAERPNRPEDTHFAHNFFAHYDRALGFLVRPRATAFWNTVVEWSHTFGSSLRIFYNGNGQTYALFILIYFVAMFLVNGGLNQ